MNEPDYLDRFWSKVDIRGEDECWEWKAYSPNGRYGGFKINSQRKLAHIISYELENGPVPDGLFVLHTCDNTKCVNPKHLYTGTREQNMKDMYDRGRDRHVFGEKHGRAKLTEEQVIDVLNSPYISSQKLADSLGVSYYTIWEIRTGRSWKHLQNM